MFKAPIFTTVSNTAIQSGQTTGGRAAGPVHYLWGNPVHVCVPGISPAGLNN